MAVDQFARMMAMDAAQQGGGGGATVDQNYNASSANAQSGTAVAQAVVNKVDKVAGKGLSANDYTTADQTKLQNCKTIWKGTQAAYDLLPDHTSYDLYFIEEAQS